MNPGNEEIDCYLAGSLASGNTNGKKGLGWRREEAGDGTKQFVGVFTLLAQQVVRRTGKYLYTFRMPRSRTSKEEGCER